MTLERPILVTGTPRSGKSVVAGLIGDGPEFHHVCEPLMIWDVELGTRDDDRRTADEATDDVRRQIIAGCEAAVVGGGARYVDDLSYHALRIPFVHAVLPEARIIHVIRPPEDAIPEMLYGWTYRDTVGKALVRRRRNLKLRSLPRHAFRFARNYWTSRVHGRRMTWGPRVPGLAAFIAEHGTAEVAAFQWRSMVEIAMDDLAVLPRDAWLEVRFDRLLARPGAEAERMAEFCGLTVPATFVGRAIEQIDPDFPFEKKVDPTDAEWEKIGPILAPVRRRLDHNAP